MSVFEDIEEYSIIIIPGGMIFGIAGAMRESELCKMKVDNIYKKMVLLLSISQIQKMDGRIGSILLTITTKMCSS